MGLPHSIRRRWAGLVAVVACLVTSTAHGADGVPTPTEADFTIAHYTFRSGETIPELRIHYRTLGQPRSVDGVVRNAVLIMHGTTGAGSQFFTPGFAGQLFGPGQPLDASQYFLIFPDDIGHGKSSKPSDGLHGKFPAYRYGDMVDAEHRLVVDGLHVNHLRLVMGTSMGGMHTWMWGEAYPTEMDALMPLASEPVQIGGRNRIWRRMIADAIRNDPSWNHGDYARQPTGLRLAAQMLYFMGSNPARRTAAYPTGDGAIAALEAYADRAMDRMDANDVLYAVESSLDYDPQPRLADIRAPLLAVNSADDLSNPSDQQLLEREIGKVSHGRAVIVPESPDTDGHGTHTIAKVWKGELERLLKETDRP